MLSMLHIVHYMVEGVVPSGLIMSIAMDQRRHFIYVTIKDGEDITVIIMKMLV